MSSFIKLDFSLCHSHEVVLFVIFTCNEIVVSKEVAFSLSHKVMVSLFGCTITIVMMSWMFLQQQLIIGLLFLMSLISKFGFNLLVIIIVDIIIY